MVFYDLDDETTNIDVKGKIEIALTELTDIMEAPGELTDYVVDKINVEKAVTALKAALIWLEKE